VKAAVLEARGVLAIRDRPTPRPEAGEVLLRVHASAVCGSDVHRYVDGHRAYPMILGHEAAGVITAAGAGVDPGLVGRHAAVVPLLPCHACDQCRAGRFSACESYSFVGSRRDGALAEFVAIPARNALLVPDDLPFEAAALVEPASVARHMLELGGIAAGQSAAVFGAGSIGLMLVGWLRVLGARPIVAVDVAAANLEAARALGAHQALDPARDDVAAEVRRLTGAGVDLALEASGSPAALAQAIEVVRPRGTVVLGGNQPLDAALPMTSVERLLRRELTLAGSFMSCSAPWPGREWSASLAAILDGGIDVAAMISHRAPLAAAPAIFEEIGARRLAHRKVVFQPADERSP
jgi:L-iditol 2-dehydrogenase